MSHNGKTALPVQAGTLGNTVSKLQANLTTPPSFIQPRCTVRLRQTPPLSQLSPRHKRIFTALDNTPEGILSFALREICKCQNIADEVMAMRRLGYNITCDLEPFTTIDGAKSKIGRYRLVKGEVAR